MSWCETLEDIDIQSFAEEASSSFPEVLMESLELYDPPLGEIRATYDNFMNLLPKCKGIVIISDGLNDNLEATEE
jgi:hypothetical protein